MYILVVNAGSSSLKFQLLNMDNVPKVIISASGMCDAGRVVYHLREVLDNPNCAVVLTGFTVFFVVFSTF